MISAQDKKNLQKINKTLNEIFGVRVLFKEGMDSDKMDSIESKARRIKDEIVESSEFNTYHKNKRYNSALLMLEAIDILKKRKETTSDLDAVRKDNTMKNESNTPAKREPGMSEKIAHLEGLYESYVSKNGADEKSQKLSDKITDLRKKVYEKDTSYRLRSILNEEADKAETIMAAKGLLDEIISHQAKIGQLLNQELDPFVRKVGEEYSSDISDRLREDLTSALSNILEVINTSKDSFYKAVDVLTGDSAYDDSIEPTDNEVGSLEDDEGLDGESGDELDLEDLDLEGGDSDEEQSEPEDEIEAQDFERRK